MTTWYVDSLQSCSVINSTYTTTFASVLYNIKEFMKLGTGTNGWGLWFSSDGAVFGVPGDLVDRWTSVSTLTDGAWAVFKSAAGIQVCIHKGATARYGLAFSLSAGFTGGGATTRPTATDEMVLGERTDSGLSYDYIYCSGSYQNGLIHLSSTDGKNLFVAILKFGIVVSLFGVGEIISSRASDTTGYVVYRAGTIGNLIIDTDGYSGYYKRTANVFCCEVCGVTAYEYSTATNPFWALMRKYDDSGNANAIFLDPCVGSKASAQGAHCISGFKGHPFSDIGYVLELDVLVGTRINYSNQMLRGRLNGIRRVQTLPNGFIYSDSEFGDTRIVLGDYSIPWKSGVILQV